MNRKAVIVVCISIVITLTTVMLSSFKSATQTYEGFAPTGGGTYRLQASIGTSDTSFTLSSFKEPVSNIKYTMSYLNSDIVYGTLDPQTSKPEFISFTGITQNADGTATLTGVTRGLSRTPAGSACIASTTLAQAHAAQSIFIVSDSPCFFYEYLPTRANATSSASLVFSSTTPPHYDWALTSTQWNDVASSTLVDLAKLQATAIAGASNATDVLQGLVELATAREAASSTVTGGTGANLALWSKYATDTPNTATRGSVIPMTRITGYLAQAWLDLTALFTFTGGLTSTGTTTISASSLTTNPAVFNSLAYRFPTARGASSTVLSEDGTGKLTWEPAHGMYTLATSTTLTAGAGVFSTSTLITIPAGFLNASSSISVAGGASCLATGSTGADCNVYLRDSTGKTLGSISIGPRSANTNGSDAIGSFTFNTIFAPSMTAETTNYTCAIFGVFTSATASLMGCSGGGSTAGTVDFTSNVTLAIVLYGGGSNSSANVYGLSLIIRQ